MGLRLLESHSQNSLILASLVKANLVGLRGLEPPTLRLSGVRSNHLSYKPMSFSALVVGNYLRPNFSSRPQAALKFSLLSFFFKRKKVVEMRRIELLTPCLQGRCSPSWATPPFFQQGSEAIPSLFSPFWRYMFLFRRKDKVRIFSRLLPLLKLSLPSFFLERKKVCAF